MGSSKGTFIDTARKSSLTENSKLIKFKSSEGIRSQCRAAVTDVCKISKISEAIERFSYDLEMKAREQNRNDKRTEIEQFDWFIERTDKRVLLFIG